MSCQWRLKNSPGCVKCLRSFLNPSLRISSTSSSAFLISLVMPLSSLRVAEKGRDFVKCLLNGNCEAEASAANRLSNSLRFQSTQTRIRFFDAEKRKLILIRSTPHSCVFTTSSACIGRWMDLSARRLHCNRIHLVRSKRLACKQIRILGRQRQRE